VNSTRVIGGCAWSYAKGEFDPTINTVVPTHPIPDYPSGHATTGGAMWAMLA
jgi:membrane-associated phospholipid phosphatase